MKPKKILVTGSSGSIGTCLCDHLLQEKYDVVGADWNNNKWLEKVDKLTVKVDLRDKQEMFGKLPSDIDLIIHLAANARVYNLVIEPELAKDNFDTVFNILEFARQKNIRRIMFASSREVYGNMERSVLCEKDADWEHCESPYSASKIGGETLALAYSRCYGVNFIIFRFSNVYGMYDESDRVIPLFIRLCKQNKDLVVFGREKQLDFTHIEDTISAVISCIPKFDDIKNDTYNIATGRGTTILEVAERIRNLVNPEIKIDIQDNRRGEVIKYIADISKAQKTFGYRPSINIEEGLKKSVEWYKLNTK